MMTKEEALQVLRAMWRYKECGYSEDEIREALDIAIAAVEELHNVGKYQEIIQIYNDWNKVNNFTYNLAMQAIGEIIKRTDDE